VLFFCFREICIALGHDNIKFLNAKGLSKTTIYNRQVELRQWGIRLKNGPKSVPVCGVARSRNPNVSLLSGGRCSAGPYGTETVFV
jgi:hypothetical protein